MATKNNPGAYDCYEKAGPDEPLFVLLARDASAPLLTHIWAAIRKGQPHLAQLHFESLMATAGSRYDPPVPPPELDTIAADDSAGREEHARLTAIYERALRDCEQADEAERCADAMIAWHMQNRQAA